MTNYVKKMQTEKCQMDTNSQFIYETHLHTSEASACGSMKGADYIQKYKQCGYSGIFVTDHFFNGNSAIDRTLDWNTQVDLYCKGYENALAQAEKENKQNPKDEPFRVFFGIEYNFHGDEYLIYGITKEWLKNHPEIMNFSHRELFAAVNKENGLIIQAHPFRLRNYMHSIHIHPRDVHGIEAYNLGNHPTENALAFQFAQHHNLPITSGSDMHNATDLESKREVLGGMAFDTPLKSIQDFIERVKFSKGIALNAK